MNPLDSMYKILIKQNGVTGKVNGIDCKFLLTECQDSNTNGLDVLTISTDQPLEQGYFVNIGTDTFLVIDKKTETKAYQSYNVGTIQKTNHLNKFVSSEVIYQCPSICTNITKGKLGMIYESVGITEAQGVWCFITQDNDISKKISTGIRFIINKNAWKCTAFDRVTDEGICYIILRLDTINQEIDDLVNEVANGLTVPNYAITLNSSTESLYGGNTFQIVANCTKNSVIDTSAVVTYTSSDTSIATVSADGIVTAQSKIGSTTINVEYKGEIATLTINVLADVFDITLNNSTATIEVGKTYQINAICKKNSVVVSSPVISYVSSDPTIATVDNNGLITSSNIGSVTITVTFENVTTTFELTVQAVAHTYTISLDSNSQSLLAGATHQIVATCTDNSSTVSSPVVLYSSSDSAIATVSTSGLITSIAKGTCIITAIFENVSSTLNLTVTALPVTTYTVNWSNNNAVLLRLMSSSTMVAKRFIDGVEDLSFIASYSLDATASSLVSQSKLSITKVNNTSYTVKNTNTNVVTYINITIKDASNGNVLEVKNIKLSGV